MHVTFPPKESEPAKTPSPIPGDAAIATMPQRMLAACKKRQINWVRVDNGMTAFTEIGRYFVADDGYFTVPADSNRYPCRDVMVGRAGCWRHYDASRWMPNGVYSTPAAFAWERVLGGWSATTDIGVYHVSDGLVFQTPGSQMAWTCASELDGKKACSLHYRKAKGDLPEDSKLDWERAAGAYVAKSSEGVYVVHDNCTAAFPNVHGGCYSTVDTHGDQDGMNRCEEHLRSRLMARDVIASAARDAGTAGDATSFAVSLIARLASQSTPLIIVEAAS